MDIASLAEGLALAKSGFDTLRTALGLAADVQRALPAGGGKDAIGELLAQAQRQLQLAEAQIAVGLGYELCRRHFPPAPMIEIGRWKGLGMEAFRVRECTACGYNNAPGPDGEGWVRTDVPGGTPAR